MWCPTCSEVQLVIADRQGIEIDYCPECRGVWLDRGELDKLIERSATFGQPPVADAGSRPDVRSRPDYRDEHYGHRKKKKRRGFLDEIFDFD